MENKLLVVNLTKSQINSLIKLIELEFIDSIREAYVNDLYRADKLNTLQRENIMNYIADICDSLKTLKEIRNNSNIQPEITDLLDKSLNMSTSAQHNDNIKCVSLNEITKTVSEDNN